MTIAEMCAQYDLTADTLRYYERVGLLPPVGRTAGGIRCYTEHDCRWVGFIKCMRTAGVGVQPLANYVRLFNQGDETAGARKKILVDERDRITQKMADMQQTLDRLTFKIERYEKVMTPVEEHLMRVPQDETGESHE